MVRTIVQLTETQANLLKERAKEQGVSLSALVREGVELVLRRSVSNAEARRRAGEAVGFARSADADVSVRHDDYLAEAYQQ